MFSLGWMEISIILIITIVVVGPKEIPTVIKFIKGMTYSKHYEKFLREFSLLLLMKLTHIQMKLKISKKKL